MKRDRTDGRLQSDDDVALPVSKLDRRRWLETLGVLGTAVGGSALASCAAGEWSPVPVAAALVDDDIAVRTVESIGTPAAPGELRSISGVPVSPATATPQVVIARGYWAASDGGGGIFQWDSSSESMDDGGIIVCPTDHTTSGRWRRLFSGAINVRWFGAVGNGTTDDLDAFNRALTAHGTPPMGHRIFVPPGTYRLSAPLNLTRVVVIEGATGGEWSVGAASVLLFDAGVHGIIVHRAVSSPETGGMADWSSISDLCVRAAAKTTAAHGITLNARARITNCFVSNFAGHGILIDSSVAVGYNSNGFRISSSRITGCDQDGIRVTGSDSNAGLVDLVDVLGNGGWGVHDTSLTGSTYLACHAAANLTGPYRLSNSGQGGLLVNCYSEGDQSPSNVQLPAAAIGGTHGAGFTADASLPVSRSAFEGFLLRGGLREQLVLVSVSASAPINMGPNVSVGVPFMAPEDTIVNATPSIAAGAQGQRFRLFDTTLHTITLKDETALPGSRLRLRTRTVTLRPLDSIELIYFEPFWYEIGRNVAVAVQDGTSTPGDVTQNSAAGRVSIPPDADTVVVTNSRVTAVSVIHATLQSLDSSLTRIRAVIPSTGCFAIVGDQVATNYVTVAWSLVE